jgi:hypothetical protein
LTADVKWCISAGEEELLLVVWFFRSLFFFFLFLFRARSLERCVESSVKRKTRFTLVTQKTSLVLLLRRAKWKEKKMESFIGGEEMGAGIWRSWENLEKLKIEEFLKF